jgi:hypothetical protein
MRYIDLLLAVDGVPNPEIDEAAVGRLQYILRAQGGVYGAELAEALVLEVPEAPPPPPPPPPEE